MKGIKVFIAAVLFIFLFLYLGGWFRHVILTKSMTTEQYSHDFWFSVTHLYQSPFFYKVREFVVRFLE